MKKRRRKKKIVTSNNPCVNFSNIDGRDMGYLSGKKEERKSKDHTISPPREKMKGKQKREPERPSNLSRQEADAMISLKKKMKAGALIISQTDKSSRFAVMTKEQYLESGRVHTQKDKKILWKDVSHLQTQVNNHVWWVTQAIQYSGNKDPKRMMRNVMNHSLEEALFNTLFLTMNLVLICQLIKAIIRYQV